MGAPIKIFLLVILLALPLTLPAQTIITNFAGVSLTDTILLGTGSSPPDTMGAAGTNQFVVFVNGAFAVYNKAGVRQSIVTDNSFWESAGISSSTIAAGLSDPRIQYDAGSGRWIASEITVDTTGNKILLGRSDTSNPSGTWKAVFFTASASGFGDFDTLGVDSLGVYSSVNIFNAAGTSLLGVSIFSMPKADLLAATPTLAHQSSFQNLSPNTYGLTLQGVNNPDTGRGHGVVVAIDYVSVNEFDRTTINGPGAAGATLSAVTQIHTAYDSPATSPTNVWPMQPGGTVIDGGNDDFSGAARQIGGYIFIANTFRNGATGRDAVHWIVLNETNNTVTSEGIVSDTIYNYTYASIAANHSGKVLMAFNRIGTTAPAGDISIYAISGTISAAGVATMSSPFVLKQGTVSNMDDGSDNPNPPNRWGDYSATMFDPTDENLVWTIQEIPISSSNWGTEVSLISFNTNRPTLSISRTGKIVTMTWPLSIDPGYTLQSTPALNNPAWTTVGVPSAFVINQRVVTLTNSGSAQFFRLAK